MRIIKSVLSMGQKQATEEDIHNALAISRMCFLRFDLSEKERERCYDYAVYLTKRSGFTDRPRRIAAIAVRAVTKMAPAEIVERMGDGITDKDELREFLANEKSMGYLYDLFQRETAVELKTFSVN